MALLLYAIAPPFWYHRGMTLRKGIRKVVKWATAVLAGVLLITWIGSGWYQVGRSEIVFMGDWTVWTLADGQIRYTAMPSLPGESSMPNWWMRRQQFKVRFGWHVGRIRYTVAPRSSEVLVPLWAPSVLAIGVACVAWRVDARARRRERVGLCVKCGYDLAASSSQTPCPECGKVRAT
jgi:hypothetical protein